MGETRVKIRAGIRLRLPKSVEEEVAEVVGTLRTGLACCADGGCGI